MIVHLLLTAWGCVAFLMFVLWLVQAKYKNASYVDIGWTIGLFICACVYVSQQGPMNQRRVLLVTMVGVWALRLSRLLIVRLIADHREDSRYARIRSDWKTHQNLKFFFMFQFQALLDVILSWGFLIICLNPAPQLGWIEYVGVGIWIIGFVGEALADNQLKVFKADPSHKGKTCSRGLWNYSRHPNYFFEWLMWVGYFLMALAAVHGWTAIVMPVLMYYFLMHVSGVPLAEAQSLKTKGEDYRRYQETTSMFVPWFKIK